MDAGPAGGLSVLEKLEPVLDLGEGGGEEKEWKSPWALCPRQPRYTAHPVNRVLFLTGMHCRNSLSLHEAHLEMGSKVLVVKGPGFGSH